ncbi:hypothetical protein RclHR1_31950003 [Rhizophagus clarus]|uniref:Uncharacterized protein n=1 Tax=Rhizophagus clarus TaxID=94130 RepID=A0A2Z6RP11_9GLOM|nr:hypothetical protein RclHR1_31950003 [Rhizophagus clarus]
MIWKVQTGIMCASRLLNSLDESGFGMHVSKLTGSGNVRLLVCGRNTGFLDFLDTDTEETPGSLGTGDK